MVRYFSNMYKHSVGYTHPSLRHYSMLLSHLAEPTHPECCLDSCPKLKCVRQKKVKGRCCPVCRRPRRKRKRKNFRMSHITVIWLLTYSKTCDRLFWQMFNSISMLTIEHVLRYKLIISFTHIYIYHYIIALHTHKYTITL